MSTIDASEAAEELTQLLDAVSRDGEVTLARHGVPVATLVWAHRAPDPNDPRFAELYAGAREIRRLVESVRHRPRGSGPGLALGRADELVAEIRADRGDR